MSVKPISVKIIVKVSNSKPIGSEWRGSQTHIGVIAFEVTIYICGLQVLIILLVQPTAPKVKQCD